jgi:hypothetical protein
MTTDAIDPPNCGSLFLIWPAINAVFYRVNCKTKALSCLNGLQPLAEWAVQGPSKGHTAIDKMRLAGDVARFVGGKKNRQRSHFLGSSQTSDGLAGDKRFPGGL